jgi:NAD(P)-dependent dehydrogenase (short-subunit alcohol dehydrogenase family)
VNAVGGSTIIANSGATVDALTLEEWQRLLDFNLTGTFLFCNTMVPVMKHQRHGKIVNFSSIAERGLQEWILQRSRLEAHTGFSPCMGSGGLIDMSL